MGRKVSIGKSIKSFLKQAVEVDPEDIEKEEKYYEQADEQIPDDSEEELALDTYTDDTEIEESPNEVLSMLNEATQQWKETGELPEKLGPPPVSLKTKLKKTIRGLKTLVHIPKVNRPKLGRDTAPAAPLKQHSKQENQFERDRKEISEMLQELNQVYK